MADPSTGTFRPLEQPERRLHGRTAVLTSGLAPDELHRLCEAFAQAALADVPIVAVTKADAGQTLGELAARPDGAGVGATPSQTPRALVLSGLREAQLHAVMAAYKRCRLPPALWATVTPTTESWTWERLLVELQRERQALGDALRQPGAAPT